MRNTCCPFCNMIFNDKHKFCNHIALKHNDQVPDEEEPLEFAYSLLVHKPVGRLCVMCRTNSVHFNPDTLKYERICDKPACKEAYTKMMKERMVHVYGKEHLLNDSEMQRKMLANHANAQDYVWDDKHKFRIIGTYERDFLDKLKHLGWSPADIISPSPNDYYYKWPDGSLHLYIPDFFIPTMSLEVEIKDGVGDAIPGREHNREIELLKDKRMADITRKSAINYIKIAGKDYDEFISTYVKSDNNAPE